MTLHLLSSDILAFYTHSVWVLFPIAGLEKAMVQPVL